MKLSKILDLAMMGAYEQTKWRNEVLNTNPGSAIFKHIAEEGEKDLKEVKELLYKVKSGLLDDEQY